MSYATELLSTNRGIWIPYFAGLFDGEGSIQVTREKPTTGAKSPSYALRLDVAQIVREPLQALVDTFGGSISRRVHKANRRVVWYWCCKGNYACSALEEMEPFLIVKRREAGVAIRFFRHKHTPRNRPLNAEEITYREEARARLIEIRSEVGEFA